MSKSAAVRNESVLIAACRPHPQNYNRHDEGQVEDLRLSLRRFGQVRSIVVQEDGAGSFLVVSGHGLHVAAGREGLAELRADVIPAGWPPVKVLAYLAADNELARRGSPDQAQLAALVAQVQQEADDELARLAAGGEMEHEMLALQSELLAELGEQLNQETGGATYGGIDRDKATRVIHPVLFIADVALFEEALARTGEADRGRALMTIIRQYLGRDHGAEQTE